MQVRIRINDDQFQQIKEELQAQSTQEVIDKLIQIYFVYKLFSSHDFPLINVLERKIDLMNRENIESIEILFTEINEKLLILNKSISE